MGPSRAHTRGDYTSEKSHFSFLHPEVECFEGPGGHGGHGGHGGLEGFGGRWGLGTRAGLG